MDWLRGTRHLLMAVCAALLLGTLAYLLIFAGVKPDSAPKRPAAVAAPKNAAADRVEKLYDAFAIGTDAAGNEGYNAAQKAEQQLRLDFLGSFQNPQRNAANQTAWDQEAAQLISDSLKYGSDATLDAAAMYWGATHLSLPVMSREQLLAQVDTMPGSDQPGERQFNEYMADYLAARFDSLNRLSSSYQSASDDIEGNRPLHLSDLQAQLRVDEMGRTLGKSKP